MPRQGPDSNMGQGTQVMSWPSHKGTAAIKAYQLMTDEEKRAWRNEKARLKAGNLCSKCKIGQRASTMTHCLKCHREYLKANQAKWKHNKKVKAALKRAEIYGGKCIQCNMPIPVPITKNLFVKFMCLDCDKLLWRKCIDEHLSVRFTRKMMIREWKLKQGILPKTAWATLPDRNKKP